MQRKKIYYRVKETISSVRLKSILLVLVTSQMLACTQLGPKFIEGSRTAYNIAMSHTETEQMLLNLVRLRYGDSPYFLEATALNTQFLLAPSATASSVLDFNGNNSYGFSGKLAYEEKPTVTYTPLKGQDFVRQMLSRISLETIALLDGSGWSSARVLNLCVESMNGLDNAAKASGPTPMRAPNVSKFKQSVNLLNIMQDTGQWRLRSTTENGDYNHIMRFNSLSLKDENFIKLASLLNLSPESLEYELLLSSGDDNPAQLRLETRSFMGVMYFLSQSVEIPPSDIELGKVRITLDESGNAFSWSDITGDLMNIKSASSRPEKAAATVEYRGSWFYIDDSDLQSKSTFQLLGQLFALQSKAGTTNAPILTLPIGG
jgi:hypothetical protein